MIRVAQLSDVVEFLSERGLSLPERISANCVIVDELLLLAWLDINGSDCEVHICVKKRGLRHLNELINAAIVYLQTQGFSAMVTTIEQKYTAVIKIVDRLGFNLVGCYNGENVYRRFI